MRDLHNPLLSFKAPPFFSKSGFILCSEGLGVSRECPTLLIIEPVKQHLGEDLPHFHSVFHPKVLACFCLPEHLLRKSIICFSFDNQDFIMLITCFSPLFLNLLLIILLVSTNKLYDDKSTV